MKFIITFIAKIFLRTIAQVNIITSNIWHHIMKYIPNYIESIYIINTQDHTVCESKKHIRYLYNLSNNNQYFVITVWNKKTMSHKYYIVNNVLLKQILELSPNQPICDNTLIINIEKFHKSFTDNNIFSILISQKDNTHLFDKFRRSIAIPNNVSAHALYLYYCYHYNIHPSIKKSEITCVDYNLDEITFKLHDLINI
jgi:hypothetical protein